MAQTIKLKRSGTEGNIPTTSQLELGEVAINTYDGKMFIKKDVGGTESIVEISAAAADAILVEYQFTSTASQTTYSGSDDNTETLSYTPNAIQVFMNGILLDPGIDFTATNGTSIVLSEAADANDYLQIFAFKKKISDGSVSVDTFTGDDSTTAFTLSVDPGDENNTRVFIDGVYQSKDNYSVSGTTLTFSTAPPTGTAIEVEIGNRIVTLDTLSDLDLPDDVKLRLGTSQDLQIYHDGSNSYIDDTGTGDLIIKGGNDILFQDVYGNRLANMNQSNSVEFYFGNSKKFETTSTGVTVTGTATADSLVVSGTNANLTLGTSGNNIDFGRNADNYISAQTGTSSNIVIDPQNRFVVRTNDTERFRIDNAGNILHQSGSPEYHFGTDSATHYNWRVAVQEDVNFGYEIASGTLSAGSGALSDTYTTRFVIKGDNGNVGIGTTNPSAKLHVDGHIYVDTGHAIYADFFRPYAGTLATYGSSTSTEHYFLGDVGIGTNSPDSKLHLRDTANPIELRFEPQGQANYPKLVGASAAGTNDTYFAVDFVTRGEALRVDGETGRVGIGTTTPDSKLTVNTTTTGDGIELQSSEVSIAKLSRHVVSSTVVASLDGVSGRPIHVGGVVNEDVILANAGGNVGIGTTSFAATYDKLAVAGGIHIQDDNNAKLEIGRYSAAASNSYIKLGANSNSLRITNNADNDDIFTIKNNGDVGIGTTSPLAKLHVNAGEIRIASSSAYNTHLNYQDSGVNIISQANSGTTEIRNSSSTLFYLNASGKVGIGTTAPNEMLQINSADSAIRVNTTNATNNSELQLLYNNSTNGMFFRYHGNSALAYIDNTYPRTQGQAYGDILFRQNYAGTMTEHMRLTAYDGYLGIFTANPKARLELNLHSGADSSLMNASTTNDVQLLRAGYGQNAATTSNAGAKWGLRFVGRNDNTFDNGKSGAIYAVSEDALGYNREVGLAFHTSPFDAANTERMRIDADGNIGIGTTSPGQLLDVAGATAPTIRITNTDTTLSGAQVIGALEFKGSDSSEDGSDVLAAIKAISNDVSPDSELAFFTHRNIGSQDDSITERMRIDNEGNVGIGTTNPFNSTNYKTLHIRGTNGGQILLGNSSQTYTGYLYTQSSGTVLGATSGTSLQLHAGGAERVRIDSSGNTGFGLTTGISGRIHVRGFSYLDKTASSAEPNIRLRTATDSYATEWGVGQKALSTNFGINHYNGTSWSQYLTITTGGNVGINHATPLTMLFAKNPSASLDYISAEIGNSTITSGNGAGFAIYELGSRVASIDYQRDGTGYTRYNTERHIFNNNAGTTEYMRIDSSGNLLIGTSVASAKLYAYKGSTGTITKFEGPAGRYVYSGTDSGGHYMEVVGTQASNRVLRIQGDNGSGTYTQLFINAGAQSIYTNSSTNVGIGTTSPYSKLQVKGSTNAFAAHFGQGQDNGNGSWGGISLGYNENNNNYRKVGIVAKAIGDTAARQELHFLVDTVNDGNNATLSDSKMMIDTSGNVCIGTTTAGAAGGATFTVNGSYTDLSLYGATTSQGGRLFFGDSSDRCSIQGIYGAGGGGELYFFTDTTGGTQIERLKIFNNGIMRTDGIFEYDGGRHRRGAYHFQDLSSASGSTYYVHFKTTLSTNSNQMTRWEFKGYNYGAGQISKCDWAVHTTASNLYNKAYNSLNTSFQANNIYESTDGYVVLVASYTTRYYLSGAIDISDSPIYAEQASGISAHTITTSNSGAY